MADAGIGSTPLFLASIAISRIFLGVTKKEFPSSTVARWINQAVVQRGWVSQENLIHYALHAEIDERHAEEFFAVIEPQWADPARRYFIEQGLALGAYAFDRLYEDLYAIGDGGR